MITEFSNRKNREIHPGAAGGKKKFGIDHGLRE